MLAMRVRGMKVDETGHVTRMSIVARSVQKKIHLREMIGGFFVVAYTSLSTFNIQNPKQLHWIFRGPLFVVRIRIAGH
jgi:hypothetical protein